MVRRLIIVAAALVVLLGATFLVRALVTPAEDAEVVGEYCPEPGEAAVGAPGASTVRSPADTPDFEAWDCVYVPGCACDPV